MFIVQNTTEYAASKICRKMQAKSHAVSFKLIQEKHLFGCLRYYQWQPVEIVKEYSLLNINVFQSFAYVLLCTVKSFIALYCQLPSEAIKLVKTITSNSQRTSPHFQKCLYCLVSRIPARKPNTRTFNEERKNVVSKKVTSRRILNFTY